MIPDILKPLCHVIMDSAMRLFRLHLPHYFNLKTKLRYLVRGIDEPDIQFIAEHYINKGQSVIDIGANVGLTAKAFAKAVGIEGSVHAIEPEYSNFKYLCTNTLQYPQVIPHRLAISNKDETRKLKLNPVSGTGNSLYGVKTGKTQNVSCVSFESFCKQEEITQVDWIKIDVEGAELDVIRGMGLFCEKFPQCRMLVELCPANLDRACTSPEELINQIKGLGYTVEALIEDGASYAIQEIKDISQTLGSKSYINLICKR